jgi:steroid delta-isomerase-like uncharacterized protein
VQRFIEEVVNMRDLRVASELLTKDFRLLVAGEEALAWPGLARVLKSYFEAFDDLNYSIEDLVAEGDKVVCRLRVTGTHTGEYDGHESTGRTFAVDEVEIYSMANGRIASYAIVRDELGFRRQLGLPLT